MQDPDRLDENLDMAEMKPSVLLEGERPRLIDEWQVAPRLWDAVRFAVDRSGDTAQFILTGSAVPPEADNAKMLHSGIGRIVDVRMRTMSLFESGESNGGVSLEALFVGAADIGAIASSLTLDDYARLICRGGWPQALSHKGGDVFRSAKDYYSMLVTSDISRVDDIKRDEQKARALLRSYARLTATQANSSAIIADIDGSTGTKISRNTLADYLGVLNRLYVIEDLPAWHPALLRKETLRTSPTRHFADPSIACAALGISPADLIRNPTVFGTFFESLAIRDLRAYADTMDGEVLHYHDKGGLEADAVIHLPNGKYALVEVKLFSKERIEEGAENLKAIVKKLNPKTMETPSFMAVITGGSIAYRRDDGVYVIPLGCLKP